MKIFVLIPTLNEEEGLPDVLRKIKGANIIVIDGGSRNGTVEIAKKMKCKVIVQDGKGKGMAFRTFLKKEKIRNNNCYVMLDGDGSYEPEYLPDFIKALKSSDVVSGYRTTLRLNPRDLLHFFGNKMISLLGFFLYGRWADICTGFWAFRGSALKKMEITSERFELEADIFSNVFKKNLRYSQVPIRYLDRKGERKLNSFDAFWIIKKLIWRRFGWV